MRFKYLSICIFALFSFGVKSADFSIENHNLYVAKQCKPGDNLLSLVMAKKYNDALQKLLINENETNSYSSFNIGDDNSLHLTSLNIYGVPIIKDKRSDDYPEICTSKRIIKDKLFDNYTKKTNDIVDKIFLSKLPASCETNSKLLPVDLAKEYGDEIMHKFLNNGTFLANLTDKNIYAYYDEWYADIIHKQFYTIHEGVSREYDFCIRDPEEINYTIGNVEISPSNQSGNPIPIYANGLMQYPITVKFQAFDKNGNTVPKFSDHMTAADESGHRMNFIRLYVGGKYMPNSEIEIPIDGEHYESQKQGWKASRKKNKYAQNLDVMNESQADSSGWHEFTYWLSTDNIAATGESVKICALISSGKNQVDSCGMLDESISLNPKPPILYSEHENATITKHQIYSDEHEDVYVDMINIQLRDSDIYDYEIEAIPYVKEDQSLNDFSLVARWAERKQSYQVAQTFYWENTLYVLANNSNDDITTDLRGFNYWKWNGIGRDEMTKTILNFDASFAGATFVNVKSHNYFIGGFSYLGWNFDPMRTYERPFINVNEPDVWAVPKSVSIDVGAVKGRDQFGNPFKVRIINNEKNGFDISLHSID